MNLSFTSKIPTAKVTEFVVPGRNRTRVLSRVVEDGGKLIEIEYKVLGRAKQDVQEEKKYTSKKGFSNFRLNIISDRLQKKFKEGYDFLMELAQAQIQKDK